MVIAIRNSHVFFQNICHPQNRLYAKTRGVTGHKDIPADTLRRHTSRWSWTSHTNLVHAAPNHTQRPWCRELNNYHKQGFDVSGTFFAISGDDWHNSNLFTEYSFVAKSVNVNNLFSRKSSDISSHLCSISHVL